MEVAASPHAPRSGRYEDGSYILRNLITDVPLSADGESEDIRITCVEVWDENLYIGTSAGEILHHVRIPPEPNDPSGQPIFILASRLQPASNQSTGVGVQQIVLLPTVGKACVLCNGTLSFYSLPELSPAFPNLKPFSCTWVGGLDQNLEDEQSQSTPDDGVVIMLCLKTKIRLVRIGDKARQVRDIEFGGGLLAARRGNLACAADTRSYALLDVAQQAKIPLFSISSLGEQVIGAAGARPERASPPASHAASRSVTYASPDPGTGRRDERGHGRSTSLGFFGGDTERLRPESPRPSSSPRYNFDVPQTLPKTRSPRPGASPERPTERPSTPATGTQLSERALPPLQSDNTSSQRTSQESARQFVSLKPHIASPTPTEFLLTTGTSPSEPGVGMFVNMDGDVVRGTLEFSSYPEALVLDGQGIDPSSSTASANDNSAEGFVLAVMRRGGEVDRKGVEVQRWDLEPGDSATSKGWIDLSLLLHTNQVADVHSLTNSDTLGIHSVVSQNEAFLSEMSQKLALRRLNIALPSSATEALSPSNDPDMQLNHQSDAPREKEEIDFARRLSKVQTRIVIWSKNQICWALRNPLVVQLDARLERAITARTEANGRLKPNRQQVEQVFNSIRGQEPRTESEFVGFGYVRQKASLLLFIDLLLRTPDGVAVDQRDKRSTEEALIDGDLDPRVVVALLPVLREEVRQGQRGIWVHSGLKDLVEFFLQQHAMADIPTDASNSFSDNLLQPIKRYLFAWRRKKGFGSISDGKEVFYTVDAALLHLLLLLDSRSPKGPATAGSVRAELNAVVDGGVDCFDRAVALLEDFKRLYVLSRLYQSRKMTAMVLATWRRILDGEIDAGGEFIDGEQELRKYLRLIRDPTLVEDYGSWLAKHNPKLGVQVFADDSSRVKFQPTQALTILRERAPDAVKEYLEHLVFGKKQTQYANDLIGYYLDIVLDELESSDEARSTLAQTYETYRALRPPKPTYRQFITENALDAEWWHSRLRLLQLLGSNQGEAASYDVSTILTRLAPYEQDLVPEMIILNGRQGRHERAIRLLTHGLGDFDTAISYCLLGGSSIFRPVSGFMPEEFIPSKDEQAKLFGYLLHEFLRIEDLTNRIERTGELLERFGGWFDVSEVLSILPDTWSIEIFSGFLVNALRRLVAERSETSITQALNGAQNLKTSAELITKMEDIGPVIETVK